MSQKIILRSLLLAGILIFIAYLISQSVGLGAGGFDTDFILQQFSFYLSGGIYLLAILIFLAYMTLKKDDEQYGNSIFFAHQGEKPSLSFFKNYSGMQLFLLFTIIFGILGLFVVRTGQTAFTGFRVLEGQQFTPQAELFYSSLLIPISENLGSAALIATFAVLLVYYAKKNNWKVGSYYGSVYIAAIAGVGIYGFTNHLLRYGGSEISLVVVFAFWSIGGALTVLTGSFIPFWVMHLMNNLLFDARRLFSSDVITIYVVGVLIALSVLYIWLYYIRTRNINNI